MTEAFLKSREERPISDYALIGDAHGAALVSRTGSIDWCCLPHINGPAFLLRLLDPVEGGFFRLAPASGVSASHRRYLPGTNIVETTFETDTGTLRLVDAFDMGMHPSHLVGDASERRHQILRLAECVSGEVEIGLACRVTPDFRRVQPRIMELGMGVIEWRWEDGAVALGASVPLSTEGALASGSLRLRAGERVACRLGEGVEEAPEPARLAERLSFVEGFWQSWASRCRYAGPYRDAVIRSALALKLLTFEPTGAIVAAPTTSLPEYIGGGRNWDYRYCWLRDATFTIHALTSLGHFDEAHDFMHWIQRVCMACGVDLQIMYGVEGERDLAEEVLEHLAGYRGSRPVRIGNAAAVQRQLDVFGEVLDSAFLYFDVLGGAERYGETLGEAMWGLLRSLVDHVSMHWEEPDSGIWEMRDRPRHFLHSKLLCWVALDRGIRLAISHALSADLALWRRERTRLRRAIASRGFSPEVGAFTQSFGGRALDASALLLPLVGFIEADDPRMLGTLDAIKEQLMENGVLYRYRSEDGLAGEEGAFSICTFWLVDALALAGRVAEAKEVFEGMLTHANDVGLYSEELDPASGEFLGNFPQGFTHIALIRSALALEAAAKG